VNQTPAVLAGCVVIFVATITKRNKLVALRVIVPDSVGTTVTDSCVLFQAVITKYLPVKIVVLSLRNARAADGTNDFFAHDKTPFRFILNFSKG
jgi:hypothetical protein